MLSFLVAVMSQEQTAPKVEDLAWLAGNWSCEIWGGTFEESWTKPSGGTMQATGRHVAEGKTTMMEFISIERVDGKVAMFISIGALSTGSKPPARFDLINLEQNTAVFQREKDDDFPKTITYTLKSKGSLECVLTGKQNGRDQHADFNFALQK